MDFLYGQTGGAAGSGFLGFLPFILIMFVIYFLMIRPQMKQQKEKKQMLTDLKKGDKVVTSGGIHGTVAGFREKDSVVILSVGKNVDLRVSKSAVAGLTGVKKEK